MGKNKLKRVVARTVPIPKINGIGEVIKKSDKDVSVEKKN